MSRYGDYEDERGPEEEREEEREYAAYLDYLDDRGLDEKEFSLKQWRAEWARDRHHVIAVDPLDEALDMEARGDLDDEGVRNYAFADPGGNSALRAASERNPRNLPCPNCGKPNRLTPADKARGYQCDSCADALERGY